MKKKHVRLVTRGLTKRLLFHRKYQPKTQIAQQHQKHEYLVRKNESHAVTDGQVLIEDVYTSSGPVYTILREH